MERLDLIAVPIMVQGEKLLRHIKTIDVPLKRYYILDNSEGRDPSVDKAIDEICANHPENIKEIVIVSNNQNSGYPGAVNQIIRDNTDCDHWIVTGFDWWVAKDQYKKLLDKDFKEGVFLGQGMDDMCGFVFTPSLIEKVGLLDENFFPGYFEDNDYKRRILLANVDTIHCPLLNMHDRSSTLNSSTRFKKKNQYTFQQNYMYYVEKWGGKPGQEKYDTPFNKGFPVNYWTFNPSRREKLRW
tara:strand:+ start:9790 stop:10515 length:726 start_codon:yes stop_codon:yes gene_type:complete